MHLVFLLLSSIVVRDALVVFGVVVFLVNFFKNNFAYQKNACIQEVMLADYSG